MTDKRIAQSFSDLAERYLEPIGPGKVLLEMVDLRPGERVLDVGCGPGTLAVAAANRVGGTGRVVAIDLAPGMLARARQATQEAPNTDVLSMDARHLAFRPGSFDVVLANSVVQFTGLPSMTEWRSVLGLDGRLACSLPHGPRVWWELCQRFVGRTREPFRSEMAVRIDHALVSPNPEAVREWLGLDTVVSRTEHIVRRYESADEAFADEYRHGARIFIEELPPEALSEFKAAYCETVMTNGGIEIPFDFHYWCFR